MANDELPTASALSAALRHAKHRPWETSLIHALVLSEREKKRVSELMLFESGWCPFCDGHHHGDEPPCGSELAAVKLPGEE